MQATTLRGIQDLLPADMFPVQIVFEPEGQLAFDAGRQEVVMARSHHCIVEAALMKA